MNASCQKLLPFSSSEIAEQVIDLSFGVSPQIIITEKEYLELKWEVGYWKGFHKKALLREEAYKKTTKEQEGQIRDLRNRLFGEKSEKKSTAKTEGGAKPTGSKRPRGQQPGSEGNGRTTRPHFAHIDEPTDFRCSH